MDRHRDRSTADTDRSEIGPYLGSPRAASGGAKKTPHPRTSEVRRFLRKRHVRRHGPPQRSDCRRHGPLGDRSLPRKSSDYIRGAKKTPHPRTSEVRRFLRKRHIRRHGPPQRSVHRRHGPLGDRSLPRRSSDYIRGAEKNTSPKHLRGKAISPKAPHPQTWTATEIGPPQTRTARRSVPT